MAGGTASGPTKGGANYTPGKNYTGPLIIVTTLFFMWGFITCLNDILIPFLKDEFLLSNLEANLVQSAFFGAYFIISLIYFIISTSFFDPIQRYGYKKAIIVGLIIGAIGCLMFIPAAETRSFVFFLFSLFVLATGVTILQMGANPYVTLLGKPETASSRLNMTQAFNSLGTTVAPVIGGLLIFGARSADAVKMPYVGLAVALVVLAVLILFSPLPEVSGDSEEDEVDADKKPVKGKGAIAYPHLILGVICIFTYVGGEVAIGSNIVAYLEEMMDMPKEFADSYLAIFWGGAMIGRFFGSILLTGDKLKMKNISYLAGILLFSFLLGVFLVNKTYIVDSFVGKKNETITTISAAKMNLKVDGEQVLATDQALPEPKNNESVMDLYNGKAEIEKIDTVFYSSSELVKVAKEKDKSIEELKKEDKVKDITLHLSTDQDENNIIVYGHAIKQEVYAKKMVEVSFATDNLLWQQAGIFTGIVLLNLLAFFLGGFNPNRTLGLFAVIVVGLLMVTVFGAGSFAMWSVLAIGLFNSIMFPNIFSLAIKGLGPNTSQGASLLVMAIVGGGVIPPLQGALADVTSVHTGFLVPVLCYAYIMFYGFIGSKPRAKDGAKLYLEEEEK